MTDVTFDAASVSGNATNANSNSWTHTPTGTPTAVGIGISTVFNSTTVTGVTYGGVACSLEKAVANGSNRSELWGLANPPPGAQTVAYTLSGNDWSVGGAVTVTDSDTSQCFSTGNNASGTGTSSTPSVTCPSATGELVMDVLTTPAGTTNPGGGQTTRWDQFNAVAKGACSTEASSGATVAMDWATSAGVDWAQVAASFKKPTGGGGVFIPIIGRGPGMALAGRGGLVAARRELITQRSIRVPR